MAVPAAATLRKRRRAIELFWLAAMVLISSLESIEGFRIIFGPGLRTLAHFDVITPVFQSGAKGCANRPGEDLACAARWAARLGTGEVL